MQNQHRNAVIKKACHSRFCRPQDSGIFRLPSRCVNKGKALYNNKYVENPRQRHSGMTANLMGFTLIELLVVVLIIGILAAVALPQYNKAVEKSRAVQAITALKTLSQAAEAYYLANEAYPTRLNQLDVSIEPNDSTTWQTKWMGPSFDG